MLYAFNPNDRTKAVRGHRLVTALALLALVAVWAAPAEAQKSANAGNPAKVQHSKLDKELKRVADGIGVHLDRETGASIARASVSTTTITTPVIAPQTTSYVRGRGVQ